MTLSEGVQVLGTVISLVGVGFAMGTAYTVRRQSHRSLESALERVRAALSSIHVSTITAEPKNASLGTDVRISFEILSKLASPLEVWLGADIVYGPEKYFYDVTQDKVVTIEPGEYTYSRSLMLTAPITAGRWTINAGVWVGKKSDPDHSIRLCLRSIDITVVGRL